MFKHAGTAAAAGLVVAALLTIGRPVSDVALVDVRQTVCGTTSLCPTDPPPDGGDQATADFAGEADTSR